MQEKDCVPFFLGSKGPETASSFYTRSQILNLAPTHLGKTENFTGSCLQKPEWASGPVQTMSSGLSYPL